MNKLNEIKRLQHLAGINEIIINKPDTDNRFIKHIEQLEKIIHGTIQDNIKDNIEYILKDQIQNNEDIIKFIINHMIFNNYEILYKGKEILLSFNNINLIGEKEINEYLKSNPSLISYFQKLIVEYYLNSIDIEKLQRDSINSLRQYIKNNLGNDEDITKYDLETIVEEKFYDENSLYLIDDIIDTEEFKQYLSKKLQNSDQINEIK